MVVYNEEFESYSELENIVRTFNEEINNEVSQATNEVPLLSFEKEKEYLSLDHQWTCYYRISPAKKYIRLLKNP